MTDSVQDRYAPENRCFGCGPANPKGLRIKSWEEGEDFVADFKAEPHHEAFPGVVNGGIVASLLDCHANWAATIHLMKQAGQDRPPCTVTSALEVKYLRPTPSTEELHLHARVLESEGARATVGARIEAAGKITATCRGVFVAVSEGHPAFHRW